MVERCAEPKGGRVNAIPLGEAWNDLTGLPLDAKEVQKARELEMKYAADKKVRAKMKREEALKR